MEFIRVNQFSGLVPINRKFDCRTCGKTVVTENKLDKRTVYCSQVCEKKYWRDKTRKNDAMKKRGKETCGFSNYSAKELAIKLWKEKQGLN